MGVGADIDSAADTVMTIIRYGLAGEWGVLGIDKLTGDDRGGRLKDDYSALVRVRLAGYQRTADDLVRTNFPMRSVPSPAASTPRDN